jgi:hypothetical protein
MKTVSTLDTVAEETYQLFDQRTRQGKHFAKQAVDYATEHPNSSVKDILNYIISRAKVNDISQIKTLDISLREMADSATKGEKIGQCVFCKKQIRHGVRFTCTADGTSLNTGENGDLVSMDKCWHNLTYLIQASKNVDFDMDELTLEKKTYEREKLDKIMIPIEQLSKKILRQLENDVDFKRYGLELESEIGASVADQIQKQILGGDITGLLRHADAARFKDTIKWAIGHKKGIYDSQVLEAVTLLEKRPDAIKDEHLVTLFLYEFQERRLQLEGELSGIKDDILYLAEKGELKLSTKLPSIKIFPRARQKHKTLADILDNNGKPIDSVTKAEATAVRLAVPRLREKRIEHNRQILDNYCEHREWNGIIQKLYETFNEQQEKYKEALENEEKNPETIWKKPTYHSLKDFFEKMEAAKAVKEMSFRDVFLNYIFMPKANETAETLFVEGQKLASGTQPRKEYISLKKSGYEKTKEELAEILSIAKGVPLDRTTYEAIRSKQVGIGDINDCKKTLEQISYGILPQKPMKKEKLQKLEEAFKEFSHSPETTEQANYLAIVSRSKYAQEIVNVNGKKKYPVIPKNIQNFEGKTHFTKEQQQTIKYAYSGARGRFPKNYDTPEQMEKQYEKITEFLKTHTVLDGSPFAQNQEYSSKQSEDDKLYQKRSTVDSIGEPEELPRITSETAKKVRELINFNNPKDKQLHEYAKKTDKQQMEKWLTDSSVRVTQSWLDNLETWYKHVK